MFSSKKKFKIGTRWNMHGGDCPFYKLGLRGAVAITDSGNLRL